METAQAYIVHFLQYVQENQFKHFINSNLRDITTCVRKISDVPALQRKFHPSGYLEL